MKANTQSSQKKIVVYQVFTRLFGNTNTQNKPWGTIAENGVGKFADFTDTALAQIKALGTTHIWFTGIPHHGIVADYTAFGISNDDPDIVKGRAGSPYAVKDYYNVNPDLALNPENRLQEFKELIERSKNAGLKVLIDIVPNHVARNYEGQSTPPDSLPFGFADDISMVYARDNNFYYIPGQDFRVPEWRNGYLPLGGEKNPLADGQFVESPAKWTGNGSREACPDMEDWYETVKINYGVRPDGTFDFDSLPEHFAHENNAAHVEFWEGRPVPDSWKKFKHIAFYWLDLGVDGFRYDMAEIVPVAFWSYLNSNIKLKSPQAFLMAEVYDPHLYRDYIFKGKMDYLYDKVDLYDGLKHIMKGYGWTDHVVKVQEALSDIEHHMVHFLENHDELRIANAEFVGDPNRAKPAMVVSATISTSPTMVYFGQEVGEPANENAGFGKPGRTSIFDYVGVPQHQRWVNHKKFDGGQLNQTEAELRDFYRRLLNFTITSEALMGEYQDIHFYNKANTTGYDHRVLSYVRWKNEEKLVVVANFEAHDSRVFQLKIPKETIAQWRLADGTYTMVDVLYGSTTILIVEQGYGKVDLVLNPLESFIFKF